MISPPLIMAPIIELLGKLASFKGLLVILLSFWAISSATSNSPSFRRVRAIRSPLFRKRSMAEAVVKRGLTIASIPIFSKIGI